MKSFDKFINEDYIPVGFGMNGSQPFAMSGGTPVTGYNMGAIVGPVTTVSNAVVNEAYAYERNSNPSHTKESYLDEAKRHICNVIDESCKYHSESKMNEDEKYEFKSQESYDRLKKREEMNIRRYRAAQDRGDNYAIKLYELRIKMDSVDKKKIEIQNAITELNKKFKKNG
tara:strand:- start:731 stop:1243 length:513 start_codon:yes stop_codon:yes gene_type:complete